MGYILWYTVSSFQRDKFNPLKCNPKPLLFIWVGHVCVLYIEILYTLTITNEHQAQLHQMLKFIQTLSSDRTVHIQDVDARAKISYHPDKLWNGLRFYIVRTICEV